MIINSLLEKAARKPYEERQHPRGKGGRWVNKWGAEHLDNGKPVAGKPGHVHVVVGDWHTTVPRNIYTAAHDKNLNVGIRKSTRQELFGEPDAWYRPKKEMRQYFPEKHPAFQANQKIAENLSKYIVYSDRALKAKRMGDVLYPVLAWKARNALEKAGRFKEIRDHYMPPRYVKKIRSLRKSVYVNPEDLEVLEKALWDGVISDELLGEIESNEEEVEKRHRKGKGAGRGGQDKGTPHKRTATVPSVVTDYTRRVPKQIVVPPEGDKGSFRIVKMNDLAAAMNQAFDESKYDARHGLTSSPLFRATNKIDTPDNFAIVVTNTWRDLYDKNPAWASVFSKPENKAFFDAAMNYAIRKRYGVKSELIDILEKARRRGKGMGRGGWDKGERRGSRITPYKSETELISAFNILGDKVRKMPNTDISKLMPKLTNQELFTLIAGDTLRFGRSFDDSIENAKFHMKNRKLAEQLFGNTEIKQTGNYLRTGYGLEKK